MQKEKGAAPLYTVKTAVAGVLPSVTVKRRPRENVTMFTDISNFAPLTALRGFCHAQHIRNMHATWPVARPRNAVIYDVSRFFRAFSGQPIF